MANKEDVFAALSSFTTSYFKSIHTKTYEYNGQPHSYLEGGEGEVLLFLHTMGIAKVFWRGVLSELASRYRVVAPDVPGFAFQSMGRYRTTLPKMSEWLEAFIEHKQFKRVHIVAQSFSGGAAAYYAAANPDKVASLCWVSLPQWFPSENGDAPYINRILSDLEHAPRDQQYGLYLASIFHRVPKPVKSLELNHLSVFRNNLPQIKKNYADLLMGFKQLPARFNHIECPVLAVYGDNNRFASQELPAKLKEWLPQIQVETFTDCSHLPALEKQTEFCEVYERFVRNADSEK